MRGTFRAPRATITVRPTRLREAVKVSPSGRRGRGGSWRRGNKPRGRGLRQENEEVSRYGDTFFSLLLLLLLLLYFWFSERRFRRRALMTFSGTRGITLITVRTSLGSLPILGPGFSSSRARDGITACAARKQLRKRLAKRWGHGFLFNGFRPSRGCCSSVCAYLRWCFTSCDGLCSSWRKS